MLRSKGASPWMRIRQPVGCRPQSGSTSMATKPYCVKRMRSTPPSWPWTTTRWAAAVPASITPATIVRSSFAAATPPSAVHSSIWNPARSASTLSGGWYSPNRWFLRRSGSNSSSGFPKRICSMTMWGDGRWERSPNSSISIRSTRRWTDSRAIGRVSVMNPGSLPLAQTDASPAAQASTTRARFSSLRRTPRANRSLHVVTTLVPDPRSATTSSTSSSSVRPARVWSRPVARGM